jgi:hypothetical protein
MWKWDVDHNGHHITVKNKTFSSELYINGRLVDSQRGAASGNLISKLPSGESVRAVVNSGVFKIHCNIYVDDVKIFTNS